MRGKKKGPRDPGTQGPRDEEGTKGPRDTGKLEEERREEEGTQDQRIKGSKGKRSDRVVLVAGWLWVGEWTQDQRIKGSEDQRIKVEAVGGGRAARREVGGRRRRLQIENFKSQIAN